MRPHSIVMFDRLYLGSLALGCVNFALQYETALAQWEDNPALAQLGATASHVLMFSILGFSMLISLLLWWLASRKASKGARMILAIFGAFGVISILLSFVNMPVLGFLAAVVINAAQIAAAWFLFRPDAAEWFKHGARGMDPEIFE